jgi:DNA mismatch repair protein MutS2
LPVKAEYKNEVQGLIHDQSSSGSTLFIEPTSVFTLNNEIKELMLNEQLEIQRILSLLSQIVQPLTDNLRSTINTIGQIDFVLAKAKYAINTDSIMPEFNDKKTFFKKARHPLIDKEVVVPIDIWFGDTFNSLIVTGPNTGGKTVTLKTVGLLTMMAQSGLFIPASSGTSIRIFDNIFTDIGDEQSIEQSLSTFSAHLTNIVSILNEATENDLVLIDEIGSGTDPIEGAAIAMAILEHLHENNITTISTTHYSELKSYAINTPGVENASCEFNVETLKPTYKLLIGVPGKSNAFAISKKLGLSETILTRANEFLTNDTIRFEDVLQDMEQKRIKAEENKEQSIKMLEDAQIIKDKVERERLSIEKQKDEILSKARKQARDLLLDAKEEASDIIKELNNAKKSKNPSKKIEESRRKLKSSLDEIQKDLITETILPKNPLRPEEIYNNMEVYIPYLDMNATVCKLPDKDGNLQVQSGIVKLNVNISKIEKIATEAKKEKAPVAGNSFKKAKDINPEINLIGMTRDEAIEALEKYMDDAYLSNMAIVRIVHGKGSGILKKAVHEYLSKNANVKSYRLGVYGEGDTGVTVVELK